MFEPINLSAFADPLLDELVSGEPNIDGAVFWQTVSRAGGPILELGCGYGRITIPLAQRGIPDLTGLELSAPSLAAARAKASTLPIQWIEADVRDFHLGRTYALIFARGNVITTVYRDLTLFLATTGLRYGEAIALQIQDIDLNHKRCIVRQAYVEVDGHLKLQTTKSGKERTAPLPNFLCSLLVERIQDRNSTELVFEGRLGRPIRNNTFRKAAWLDAKKTDPAFAKLRIHDLRAIALTSLGATADLNLADLQKIAGHASATTTSVYLRNSKNDLATHAATSFDTEYGEQFDNALTEHPPQPQESKDDQPSERKVGSLRKLADKKPKLRPKYPTSVVLKEVKGDR